MQNGGMQNGGMQNGRMQNGRRKKEESLSNVKLEERVCLLDRVAHTRATFSLARSLFLSLYLTISISLPLYFRLC